MEDKKARAYILTLLQENGISDKSIEEEMLKMYQELHLNIVNVYDDEIKADPIK